MEILLGLLLIIFMMLTENFFRKMKQRKSQYDLYWREDLMNFCLKNEYNIANLHYGEKIKKICFIEYSNGEKICRIVYNFDKISNIRSYLIESSSRGEVARFKIMDRPIGFNFYDPLRD